MSQHRKHRGYASQRIVADRLRDAGFLYAEPVGAGRPGSDVTGIVGVDLEVKARRGLDLPGTLRQQAERLKPGDLGFAVIRPDGYGPARIDEWPVAMTFGQFVGLLEELGYR